MFARSPHEIAANHALPRDAGRAESPGRRKLVEPASALIGMSFWTDAAVLSEAGIPSILFGPTGGGLHSIEEWVDVQSVLTCRDALVTLARDWCRAV